MKTRFDNRKTAAHVLGDLMAELCILELDFAASWYRNDSNEVVLRLSFDCRINARELATLIAWSHDDTGREVYGRTLSINPDDGLVVTYTYDATEETA